ncbi:MAG: redox-regulated ATPase YchF [Planctomycetes bacterium]|nr:redox-regulated ATPase YchF [Planctomycetota bacterium]
MKIGIIGLPQTGKKTLYEIVTGHPALCSAKSGIEGVAEIADPRFDKLVALYQPTKQVRAKINIKLLPKLEPGSASEPLFKEMSDTDVLVHIVRAFKDDSVYHIHGSIDPKRDIDEVNAELILYDLMFIEKRLERIDKEHKRSGSDEAMINDKELLLKLKAHLEKEMPLRLMELRDEEKKVILNYQLVTIKKMIVVLNVSEDDVNNTALFEKFRNEYAPQKIYLMHVSAKVEDEIAALESEKERKEFIDALGIVEPATEVFKRLCIEALNLVSFFTVRSDEVRQWLITKGATAPKAAGAIHTDLERGFIRAEIIKCADLFALGTEHKVKEAGKLLVKGKDYIVEDGDIITIRFNV